MDKRIAEKKHWFASMAQTSAWLAGSSPAFMAICVITLAWLVSGPLFHWSDTWQLVINTVTNIISMLMVFLIQNTQNRESAALQLKVDELLRAVSGAQNAFINLEDLTEEDLERIKERYAALAERARRRSGVTSAPGLMSPELDEGLGGDFNCALGPKTPGKARGQVHVTDRQRADA
jgi:low affinity Fe/Cu permease